MTLRNQIALTLARLIGGRELAQRLATVSVRIDDSPGWTGHGRRPHDLDYGSMQKAYMDSLDAWRKNPLAWRTIQLTTDYVVGQKITISSPDEKLQRFIRLFWNHPMNRMELRMETMCEELARSGDLFPLLFRNAADGMSYVRFLTKDQIARIDTRANDWETEMVIHQHQEGQMDTRAWFTPAHGRSSRARAVALHYSINRPLGAQFGESDLTSIIPWLLRYSRLLEGRIRLHWAARAFLWFVTVPTNKVYVKQEEYQAAPEPGSVIVKDDAEEWDMKTPNLRGTDAQHDMRAARQMIDAGSGYPPHWRGEATDVNLATAKAMQEPTERHLARRQKYFVFMLQDLIYQAYLRAHEVDAEAWPLPTETDYNELFLTATPDISRSDNMALAAAAKDMTSMLALMQANYPGSDTLRRLLLSLVLKFAGEPQDDDILDQIISEAGEPTAGETVPLSPTVPSAQRPRRFAAERNGSSEGQQAGG